MKTKKNTIKLTEGELKKIISESVTMILSEARQKRSVRTGTIEMNGEHIRATEDGVDKYGNPMYKVKHPSIKGRKTKDGYTRVQHFNFKPDSDISESIKRVLKENAAFDVQDNLLESFDELKNALMEIRDVYSFDDYLENLSFAIQSACRVINELTALNNNR